MMFNDDGKKLLDFTEIQNNAPLEIHSTEETSTTMCLSGKQVKLSADLHLQDGVSIREGFTLHIIPNRLPNESAF